MVVNLELLAPMTNVQVGYYHETETVTESVTRQVRETRCEDDHVQVTKIVRFLLERGLRFR
jgi:hypothetical protein